MLDDIVKLTAMAANKSLHVRRALYVRELPKKDLKERLKKCAPQNNLLFGGTISKLTKALKDEKLVKIMFFMCSFHIFPLVGRPGQGLD